MGRVLSQVESDLIYPSLPALVKMAEVLSVEVLSFFQESADMANRVIFPGAEAVDIKFQDLPEGNIHILSAMKLFFLSSSSSTICLCSMPLMIT